MKHFQKYACSFAFIFTLAACGGGGGGNGGGNNSGGGGNGGGSSLPSPDLVAPAAQAFEVDSAITSFTLTNTGGGQLSSCTAATFPAGLSVALSGNRSSCVVSGTPTQIQSATTHNITATNATGSSTVGVEISVAVSAPDLQNTAPLSFEQNESLSIEFTNAGGAVDQCTATSLNGLSVAASANGETCVLSGAISTPQTGLEIDVTATNASGQSTATAFLTITPTPGPLAPPALQNVDAGELIVGANANITVSNTGGGQLSQCASSDLPNGLVVAVSGDATQCVITGAPTTPQAQGNSQVTATNASGNSSATVTLSVVAAPVLLSAPEFAQVLPQTYVEGTATSLTLVNNGGGMLSACSGANLPAGLAVSTSGNASTCILSGTPTAVQSATDATITATNATGSDNVVVSIAVEAAPVAAPSLDSVAALTIVQNESFSQTINNSGGGELSACTASGLPAGLSVSISGNSCLLSGTPTTVQSATNATVTATNATASSTVTFAIEVVNPNAPFLTSVSGLSFEEGENFTIEFENTGGTNLTSCDAVLPGGLNVRLKTDNTTCILSGFVGVPQDNLELSIVATNDSGESTATVNLVITGPAPFITTWDTTQTVSGNTNALTIYTSTGRLYNYSIDWGNGTINENVTGNITHFYDSPGVYTVTISGNYPQPCISVTGCGGSDAEKIVSIDQWGDNAWQSMAGSFQGSPDFLINDPLSPDLSQVESMANMFRSSSFNQQIDNWDVSNVTVMEGMFRQNEVFNQPLGSWDVSSVTNMAQMFLAASAFNQDISSWRLDSIENITVMFGAATVFNQDISVWDVSRVTDMTSLFVSARAFNQDLSAWDVSNVTNMQSMFEDARSFNQDLSAWDVSNVEVMNSMFAGALEFNGDISSWTTSSLQQMESMFELATAFNQDISSWNVSNVVNMESTFQGATSFDQNLGPWIVSGVTDMEFMFTDSGLSVANYDNLLEAWSMLLLRTNVTLDVTQNYSSSSQAFRDVLTDPNGANWTINDLGPQ